MAGKSSTSGRANVNNNYSHKLPGDFERALVGLGGIGGIPSGGEEETIAPLVGRDGIGGGPSSSMI